MNSRFYTRSFWGLSFSTADSCSDRFFTHLSQILSNLQERYKFVKVSADFVPWSVYFPVWFIQNSAVFLPHETEQDFGLSLVEIEKYFMKVKLSRNLVIVVHDSRDVLWFPESRASFRFYSIFLKLAWWEYSCSLVYPKFQPSRFVKRLNIM